MDPTLSAIVTALVVFASAGVVARSRRSATRSVERARSMAIERGLGTPEVGQLEHLARMLPETTLADLLISPIRFDRAVAQYVRKLRTGSTSGARYFAVVSELTRLRRKVHPPGARLRFLCSTRELPEGEQIRAVLLGSGTSFQAVIWSVNEDHFELRPEDLRILELAAEDRQVRIELTRPGQGRFRLEARVRSAGVEPAPRLRLEHTEEIILANRREYVRERRTTPVFVTPEGASTPIEASLADIGGGGVAFVAARPIDSGTRATVFLTLDDEAMPPLKLPATVLRVGQDDQDRWRHSCRWDDVDDDTRELIIRFVFGLQRLRVRATKAFQASSTA